MAVDRPPDPLPDREITLNDIDRTHELLSNRVAIKALYHLYRHETAWIAQDTDRQTTTDAIALLKHFGLATALHPGVPDPDAPACITSKGRHFADVLDLA